MVDRWLNNEFGFKYREIKSDLNINEQRSQVHTLTHNAVFFLLEGELMISWDDYSDINIQAGELFFLPRGANVSACMLSNGIKYAVARLDHDLDSKSAFQDLHHESDLYDSYIFSSLPIKEPINLFIESIKCYIINRIDTPRLQSIKSIELYILFRKCYTKSECLNLFHPIISKNTKFKTFILDNYNVSISIDELAEKANMSRSTFDRTFKENFGMTPHKWIDVQTRILIHRKASEPNVTVKDIMYEVGVYNPSQFTQLCKRLCGVSPSKLLQN